MAFFSKFKEDVDKAHDALVVGATGVARMAKGIFDPNSAHDDPEEKAVDKIRAAICASHRFGSFATQRRKNVAKWYIDGHDYFYAVSELIESAKECIFILDWWLSPELYLRRPASDFPHYRLDRLLKTKAEQGVKIYICVYKEITQTMNMSSKHTKDALQALHPNIKVMRHPDHIGTAHDVQFWSHHEKLLVVDNHYACVGGLDMCFGRWDTHNHPLADAHPTDFSRTIFPGQDYNNGRVLDFQQVDNFVSNQISILEIGRMPWHDVHASIAGDAVLDLVQHFVERWNKIKKEKYVDDVSYDYLAFPHNIQKFPNEATSEHPDRQTWDEMGTKFTNLWHQDETAEVAYPHINALTPFEPPSGVIPDAFPENHPKFRGTCDVQVLRSAANWSHGVLKEQSIQNAYIQLIAEANHFIYIENQFFISNTGDKGPVQNKVAKALTERILSAAKNNQKFKVIIVIPEVPAFSGDIEQENSIQTIMAAQWRTINRGGDSIYEVIRNAGYEPTDYIRFFHLRTYDRINAPASYIEEMHQKSGVSFFQAQVAQARLFIGDDGEWHQDTIKITKPSVDKDMNDQKNLGTTEKANTGVVEEVKYPPSSAEAAETIKRYQAASPRSDEEVSDSVNQHVLQDPTTLQSEKWLGTEQEERDCYVSELLYIHSKVMVVDDRRVIIGSANLNDRSMKGDGDSEIAIVIEDTDMIESSMNGKPYMASRFAASFRRKMMREHLGLVPPQPCETGHEPVTSFMRSVPYPAEDETRSEEDRQVEDPLSDEFLDLWNGTAQRNRQVFADIFKTVPSDVVRTWEQYKAYIPKVKTGHIATDLSVAQVKEKLSTVRGALVTGSIDFLIDEKKLVDNADWLGINPTLPIYI